MVLLTDYVVFGGKDFVQEWAVERIGVVEAKGISVFWAGVADEGFLGAEVLRWEENAIEAYFERVLQHGGYEPGQERAGELEARIGVYLNQIRPEFIAYHEVQTEDLHAVEAPLWVQLAMAGSENIGGHLVHLW